jgi:hypothetical protein
MVRRDAEGGRGEERDKSWGVWKATERDEQVEEAEREKKR